MADLTITQGDTWPPLRGGAADETGILDLTTADALEVILDGAAGTITGTAVPIDPPITDADGNVFNWKYTWAAGDTDNSAVTYPATYVSALKVTWDATTTPPQIEYFPNTEADTVTIKAKPA